jgi:C-terminal processing protease CtpA/Prc
MCEYSGTLTESSRETVCVSEIGIGHAKFYQSIHIMHHQFGGNSQTEQRKLTELRLISRRFFGALMRVFLSALLLMACAPKNIFAQPEAVGVPQRISQLSLTATKPIIEPSFTQSTRRMGGGYLGVYLGDVNEERAKQLRLNEVRGAVVGKVEESSPAANVGLQENDVILAFNDQQVQNRAQLYRLLIESPPGSKVNLEISRAGESRKISVELGSRRHGILDERQRLFRDADAMLEAAEDRRKEAEELRKQGKEKEALNLLEEEKEFRRQSEERRAYVEKQIREGKIQRNTTSWLPHISINANRYYLGLITSPLGEQLAKYFNVTHGVLVSEVRAGGAAERAGIKAGDCIIAVNDERISSTSDLNRLVDRSGKDESFGEKTSTELLLTVVRDRNEQKIKVKIEYK